jgi:hypothetical protein
MLPLPVSEVARSCNQWPIRGKQLVYRNRKLAHDLGRFVGVERTLEPHNLIAQGQTPLLQAAQHEFVRRCVIQSSTVNQCVQITVLHAQFDQPALREM